MKVYFERTTHAAIVIWATTTVEILIAAILYIGLRTVSVQESTSLLITLFTLVVLIILGFLLFQTTTLRRKDTKREKIQQFRDQHAELEKRAEERFQFVVSGLGDEKEGARIGAAILLRTFLLPGYEQFYMQTFDLAVAHLRLPRTPHPPEDSDTALPLSPVSQALIAVFKEAFLLARERLFREGVEQGTQFRPQSLDAMGIYLDNAYLSGADLDQAWMPQASLRNANLRRADLIRANLNEARLSGANLNEADLSGARLSGADLSKANLNEARLSGADLSEADLSEANLSEANLNEARLSGADLSGARLSGADLSKADLSKARLSGANLSEADLSKARLNLADLSEARLSGARLSGADLSGADLSGADLSGTNLEDALSLDGTDLRGVKGVTKEQLAACKAKGAIIDEDTTTS